MWSCTRRATQTGTALRGHDSPSRVPLSLLALHNTLSLSASYAEYLVSDMAASSVTINGSGAVPVVDFGLFLNGTDRQAVADAMLHSFQNIGFVQLVNHGLPQAEIEAMFSWVSLPMSC